MEEINKFCKWFSEHKNETLALDVEMQSISGSVAVVGLARLYNSYPEYQALVAGRGLNKEAIEKHLGGIKVIMTFNGGGHDLIEISRILGYRPDVAHIDLMMVSRELGITGGLKDIERQLGVKRDFCLKVGPIDLWRRYEASHDKRHLKHLLDYNYEDTVNLFEVAEKLLTIKLKMQLVVQ